MSTTSFAPSFGGSWAGSVAAAWDVPITMPVAIAGHSYRVDLSQYSRETVDALRTAYDTLAEPGEQSLSTTGVWRRNQTHWEMGAGQTHWDERDSDQFRYRISKGVDPWTVRTLRLLHDTADRKTTVNTNGQLLPVGAYLYVVDGTNVYSTTDPTVGSPTWTSSTINIAEGAQTVTSITTDGKYVYAACGVNGINKTLLGAATSSDFSTFQADLVGFANGRLLATKANDLREVDNAGTATSIFTHFSTDFVFKAISAAPSGIFTGGNTVERGEFQFIGFDASSGDLAFPLPAGTLPRGEFINAMKFYGNVMILCTSKGVRLGTIVGDKAIAIGPLIDAPGDVKCVDVDADFMWFGWTNYDGTSTGIGRARLSKETEPLVPPYASDLMATGQGVVLSVASYGGRRYFCVSGDGVYGETANLVAEGSMNSGLVRWGTMEHKVASAASLKHDPLDGSVVMNLIDEDGIVFECGVSDAEDSTEPRTEFGTGNLDGETIETQLLLRRSGTDTTLGPVVRRWTTRAQVVSVLTDAITVPIILKTKVDNMAGEGQPVAYDTLAEFLFLKGLEAARVPVTYQEGDLAQQVTVDKVVVKPDQWIGNTHRWFEGLVIVRLLTVQPLTGS